jgi:hypothetical protein
VTSLLPFHHRWTDVIGGVISSLGFQHRIRFTDPVNEFCEQEENHVMGSECHGQADHVKK